MKLGAWHQCGDKSQKMVIEELEAGKGEGVVISPRDVPMANAEVYASKYRALGAQVAVDMQFYVPTYTNSKLETYSTEDLRKTLSPPRALSSSEKVSLQKNLEDINRRAGSAFLIAPALICEAGQDDVMDLNLELLEASVSVGGSLGVPTFSTICIGRSATQSDGLVNAILSGMTSRDCDGWYFAFEFDSDERLPTSVPSIKRMCRAVLALACTGLPVFHAYAGATAVMTIPCGAQSAGVGHWHNLWQFQRERWAESSGWTGGPKVPPPPRFFSKALWGTIIYQDETRLLPTALQTSVLQTSPFSAQVGMGLDWDKWSACKHLLSIISDELTALSGLAGTPAAFARAKDLLANAVANLNSIAATGIALRDDSDAYQANWLSALEAIEKEEQSGLEYLALLR